MKPLHLAAALLMVAVWGLNFVVIRWGLDQVPPLTLTLVPPLVLTLAAPTAPALASSISTSELGGTLATSEALPEGHRTSTSTPWAEVPAAKARAGSSEERYRPPARISWDWTGRPGARTTTRAPTPRELGPEPLRRTRTRGAWALLR